MSWHAMPPEVNTSRLMLGAGPAPMLQAAAGWEAMAILLETQADELAASLTSLSSAWTGAAGDQAVQATMPMVLWLRTTSLQAQKRALQATAQATAYTAAMLGTPPLVEIEANHVTHGVLEATNFLGVNAVPIGLNEADYFVRMWNQAAFVMDAYQAETTANTLFEPIMPIKPIVVPGVAQAGAGAALGQIATMAPGALVREISIASVSARAKMGSMTLQAGRAAGQANMAAQRAEGQAQKAENAAQNPMMQQGTQMAMQMGSQLGSMAMQLPQQATQMVTQPLQQLTSPLQQMTSMFSGMGNSSNPAQMGLMGASPFSNHPLAGGSGAGTGAGLVRAASLPGMGGSMAQTPLMANLVGKPETPLPVGAGAGSGGAGLAPVGSGGGAPMGMTGQNKKSGGSKAGLQAPSPLAHDLGEDEDDDW
ncbi:PPE family protein [Mycolicibacterium sp. YH-1]|uniref:PPE family protein n=1 Tax=Mycolicibacterium sp. YH-1 TaxID=2908837 RepID=UPI001F4BD11A|nr:PPE family protein [Mycolicibacterium sp. YH-1]UNB52766.1 PPE family protein [Mycolicibacterium sp. YH-1]